MPSATAARVAWTASSTRDFFSLSSLSVDAPTLINATPPDNGDADTADTGDDNGNGNALTFEINIDANGITFGPKGKVRVTRETTTLYSDKGNTEIDYLDKGQKVVVAACENKGKGWCQVIKPRPGLIWGGDLK